MWARTARNALQGSRLPAYRTSRFVRRYQNTIGAEPHKTYFQKPQDTSQPAPKRRWGLRILGYLSTATVAFILGLSTRLELSQEGDEVDLAAFGIDVQDDDTRDLLRQTLLWGAEVGNANRLEPMDVEFATRSLVDRSWFGCSLGTATHGTQNPSNLPCEDTFAMSSFGARDDDMDEWHAWSIFDGHAGLQTAAILKRILPVLVSAYLVQNGSMERPHVPYDPQILKSIKDAFTAVDKAIFDEGMRSLEEGHLDRAKTVSLLSKMYSGSCALMAIYDPREEVLRVANTGDSRAVLGRWDAVAGKYVADAMSEDHTGFNQSEVERLKREHPGEDPIDPKTGRIFGLAVTRAFGDGRWKIPEALTRLAHEKFWGPAPRPNGVVKTPPYLTVEPEIKETKVQTGAHPDFLIMASDGLWDLMSNQHAVECVSMWLQRYHPLNLYDQAEQVHGKLGFTKYTPLHSQGANVRNAIDEEDEETYFDESERTLKWKVSPKHFVVEDDHCGVHLIKNALGGKRRGLFTAVMGIQPPLSRNVRDDITVQVVFFGMDDKSLTHDTRGK